MDELKRVKIDVKTSTFCNSCYICLCDVVLMACASWELCLLNNMDIEKSKMNQTKFQYQILV